MRKAQISMEFIFAIGMIFFIFLMLLAFRFNRNAELRESEIEIDKRNTCLLVSSLITSAFVNGDGIVISESIDHEIDITGTDFKNVYVDDINCWLSVHDIPNGNLPEGNIKIENQDNDITIITI